MKGERLVPQVLSAQLIPNASPALCKALKLKKHYPSLALLSVDSDDVCGDALALARELFGKENMGESKAYLSRLQKLF
mgnify:CR=1 FL=1